MGGLDVHMGGPVTAFEGGGARATLHLSGLRRRGGRGEADELDQRADPDWALRQIDGRRRGGGTSRLLTEVLARIDELGRIDRELYAALRAALRRKEELADEVRSSLTEYGRIGPEGLWEKTRSNLDPHEIVGQFWRNEPLEQGLQLSHGRLQDLKQQKDRLLIIDCGEYEREIQGIVYIGGIRYRLAPILYRMLLRALKGNGNAGTVDEIVEACWPKSEAEFIKWVLNIRDAIAQASGRERRRLKKELTDKTGRVREQARKLSRFLNGHVHSKFQTDGQAERWLIPTPPYLLIMLKKSRA